MFVLGLSEKDVFNIFSWEEKVFLKEVGLSERKIVFSDKKEIFVY